MLALQIIGWIAVAAGAVASLYGATEGAPFFLVAGLSAVVSGILYLALAKGLDLLAEIRDRLPAAGSPRPPTEPPAGITEPAGNLADLEARLDAMKRR